MKTGFLAVVVALALATTGFSGGWHGNGGGWHGGSRGYHRGGFYGHRYYHAGYYRYNGGWRWFAGGYNPWWVLPVPVPYPYYGYYGPGYGYGWIWTGVRLWVRILIGALVGQLRKIIRVRMGREVPGKVTRHALVWAGRDVTSTDLNRMP